MTGGRIPTVVAALGLLVSVVACGESADTTTTGVSDPSTSVAPTTSLPPSTTSLSTGDGEVQDEIDWFVGILNGDELTPETYELRFNEEFRLQVPLTQGMEPVLEEFRPQGPFTVVERTGEGQQGEAVVESADGTKARILAELDAEGRFAGLVIQPAETPTLEDPPESIEEAFGRLETMGTLGAITAEVSEGECSVVQGANLSEPAPLGSVFKLYVLAALGEAVATGDLAWDDELRIQDSLKSIPTGVLQDRADGDVVTVREAAELMISISDNTATDHLIDLLGRQEVEAVMAEYGNTNAGLNIPLMSTREFTALKVGPASGLRIQWLDGDEQTRRSILTQISDIAPADLPLQEWVEPIEPDQLEWFASPEDLCTLAIEISALIEEVPEVGEILAINPGVPAEDELWDSIWFKGGSEPGLLAAWFVTQSGGRMFVTAGSVVNSGAVVDTEEAILLLAAARDLLAP